MDKRKYNKGTKGNKGGRPSKAEEQQLIEMLDKHIDRDDVFQVLKRKIKDGDFKAIQLYFNYLYGKPKETKDVTINTEQPLFDLNDI